MKTHVGIISDSVFQPQVVRGRKPANDFFPFRRRREDRTVEELDVLREQRVVSWNAWVQKKTARGMKA